MEPLGNQLVDEGKFLCMEVAIQLVHKRIIDLEDHHSALPNELMHAASKANNTTEEEVSRHYVPPNAKRHCRL